MKTAIEIAMLTKKNNQRLLAERHDRTMNYINNTMEKAIEKNAIEGEYQARFRVSESVDRDIIARVFTEQGFEVIVKGYDVKISWFNQYVKIGD